MNIDPLYFKAFKVAAQQLNFTEASRLLGMTQSGVSQHIAKLEVGFGVPLFQRVGKKVLLTEAGDKLLSYVDKYFEEIEVLQNDIHATDLKIKGLVKYSMPESCLLSPHFTMLLKDKAKNFSEIDLDVSLSPSEIVVTKVLDGEIDFGFVTKKYPNDALTYKEFCQEEYVLATSTTNKVDQENLTEQNWVHYPEYEVLVELWLKHHFSKSKTINNSVGRYSGNTNSIHVAIAMVANGLGVSIFPKHCLESSELKSKLGYYQPSNSSFCKNMIYIVHLKDVHMPKRISRVIQSFMEM